MAFAPNNQKTCLPNPPARETLSLSFRCSSRLFAHVGGSSPPQKGQNSVYTILYPPQSWLTWMAWPMGRRIHPNTKLVVPYTSVGRVDTQMIHVSWSPPPPSNVRAVSKSSERHTDVRLLPLLTVDAESTPGVVETSVQQVGKPGSSGRPNHGFPVDLPLNLSIEWERRGKAWEFLLL